MTTLRGNNKDSGTENNANSCFRSRSDTDEDSEVSPDNLSTAEMQEGDEYLDKTNSARNVKQDGTWQTMYSRLVKFREEHGHCLVPNRYKDDRQLGAWVAKQRRHFKLKNSKKCKSTPMTTDRERRLQDIGFEWSAKNPRCVPWETRFLELLQFVVKHGHAQVPLKWQENVQLSNWVSAQRQEYKSVKKGNYSRLTQNRIKLLESVGFIWEAQRGSSPRLKAEGHAATPNGEFRATVEALLRAVHQNRALSSEDISKDHQDDASHKNFAATKREKRDIATLDTFQPILGETGAIRCNSRIALARNSDLRRLPLPQGSIFLLKTSSLNPATSPIAVHNHRLNGNQQVVPPALLRCPPSTASTAVTSNSLRLLHLAAAWNSISANAMGPNYSPAGANLLSQYFQL